MKTRAHKVSPGVLKGLPLLQTLTSNHAVGVMPHETVREIAAAYGIDLKDLRASAAGQGRDESRQLEIRAMERVAYVVGKHDGVRIVASRQGFSSEMDAADFREVLHAASSVPSANSVAYQGVFDVYARGMRAAAALLWVGRNNPMERRRQVAEARAIRAQRDPVGAEALVESSQAELSSASEDDVASYATALSAHVVAEESANLMALEALRERALQEMRGAPHLAPAEALRRARMAYRVVADTPFLQQAYRRAAWAAIPMSLLEGQAREERDAGLEVMAEFDIPHRGSAVTY